MAVSVPVATELGIVSFIGKLLLETTGCGLEMTKSSTSSKKSLINNQEQCLHTEYIPDTAGSETSFRGVEDTELLLL